MNSAFSGAGRRHARHIALSAFVFAMLTTPRLDASGTTSIPIVDQRGAVFSLAALPQRFVAVTFVASRCADACPIADALFAKLQTRIVQSHRSVGLVTLTLDPEFDTPFVMSGLSALFKANPAVWRFGSGPPANVRALMRLFGIVVQPDEKGIPDAHTTAVYILDSHRALRKILLLSASLPEDVLAATR